MSQIFKAKRGRPPLGVGPRTRLKWMYCVECGVAFYVVRKNGTNVREKLHCSDRCKYSAWCVDDEAAYKKLLCKLGQWAYSNEVASLPPRQCAVCGDMFQPNTLGIHKYCSADCKVAMDNTRRKRYRGGKRIHVVSYKVIHERDGGKCQLCGKKVSPKHRWPSLLSGSMDHIIPLSTGGEHIESNIQLAHLGCNMSKSNKYAGQLRLF